MPRPEGEVGDWVSVFAAEELEGWRQERGRMAEPAVLRGSWNLGGLEPLQLSSLAFSLFGTLLPEQLETGDEQQEG